MKINFYNDEAEWKMARRTKITGSRLKDVVVLRGDTPKKAFYELIAEGLAKPRPEGEDVMLRGHLLEKEAIELVENELQKEFNKELVIWERDDTSSIAISPDAYLEDLTEAVEVKCLNSAEHIESVILNKYPDKYKFQVLQYFIVNDDLRVLHFVMYDPSLSAQCYKRFEIKREDLAKDIEKYLNYQREVIKSVNELISKLSF